MESHGSFKPDPRWRETAAMHSRTRAFARRVESARRILQDGAELGGEPAISISWGKDSTVATDISVMELGPLKAIHLASCHEIEGWQRVRDHFASIGVEISVIEPTRTVEEMIEFLSQVGLCYERVRDGVPAAKGRAMRERLAELGLSAQIMGLRRAESRGRRLYLRHYGPAYRRQDGVVNICPLAWWSAQDVWAWIVSRDLPYHEEVYDRENCGMTRMDLRNGGWMTTQAGESGRVRWLRRNHPREFERLAEAFPKIRRLL